MSQEFLAKPIQADFNFVKKLKPNATIEETKIIGEFLTKELNNKSHFLSRQINMAEEKMNTSLHNQLSGIRDLLEKKYTSLLKTLNNKSAKLDDKIISNNKSILEQIRNIQRDTNDLVAKQKDLIQRQTHDEVNKLTGKITQQADNINKLRRATLTLSQNNIASGEHAQRIDELNGSLNTLKQNMDEKAHELNSELVDLDERNALVYDTLDQKYNKLINKLIQQIASLDDQIATRTTKQINKQVNQIKEQCDTQVNQIKEQCNTQVNQYNTHITEQIEQCNTHITEQINKLNAQQTIADEKINNRLDEQIAQVDERLDEQLSSLFDESIPEIEADTITTRSITLDHMKLHTSDGNFYINDHNLSSMRFPLQAPSNVVSYGFKSNPDSGIGFYDEGIAIVENQEPILQVGNSSVKSKSSYTFINDPLSGLFYHNDRLSLRVNGDDVIILDKDCIQTSHVKSPAVLNLTGHEIKLNGRLSTKRFTTYDNVQHTYQPTISYQTDMDIQPGDIVSVSKQNKLTLLNIGTWTKEYTTEINGQLMSCCGYICYVRSNNKHIIVNIQTDKIIATLDKNNVLLSSDNSGNFLVVNYDNTYDNYDILLLNSETVVKKSNIKIQNRCDNMSIINYELNDKNILLLVHYNKNDIIYEIVDYHSGFVSYTTATNNPFNSVEKIILSGQLGNIVLIACQDMKSYIVLPNDLTSQISILDNIHISNNSSNVIDLSYDAIHCNTISLEETMSCTVINAVDILGDNLQVVRKTKIPTINITPIKIIDKYVFCHNRHKELIVYELNITDDIYVEQVYYSGIVGEHYVEKTTNKFLIISQDEETIVHTFTPPKKNKPINYIGICSNVNDNLCSVNVRGQVYYNEHDLPKKFIGKKVYINSKQTRNYPDNLSLKKFGNQFLGTCVSKNHITIGV